MKFPKGTTRHPINKSGKKKILVSVWDFGATHPQTERNHYKYNDHPAKMRPSLARAILQVYGESPVLDPMAGIGTTLVEAMLLGMDAVGVEYEKKFVRQANKNIKHVRKSFRSKKLGRAVCIEGDARDLSCLKKTKVRSILLSPPYFDAIKSVSTGHQGPEGGHLERQHKRAREGKSGYGNEHNVGHIEEYGSIVFSPPYFNALKKADAGPHSNNKRIPYEERIKRFQGYSTCKGNIGNISRFGSIVFSPPYFDALSVTKGGGSKKSIVHEESTKELQMKRSGPFAVKKNLPTPYSSKEGNIGNIPRFGSIKKMGNIVGQTYLGEMFKVYRECYRVLKPGKFTVVVVKDIQRNWKTVPLGADTIKLCQAAGFDCHDVIVNKMYFPSFWMLNLAKKAQTEGIEEPRKFHALKSHEYVLVFRKPLP